MFSCQRCSRCCFFKSAEEAPIVLPHEVALLRVLARRLEIRGDLVFEKTGSGFYRWVITGYCPFYDEEGRSCRIHADKPIACRIYPLLVNLFTMELSLSKACTWVNEHISVIEGGELNPRTTFPNEYQAVVELLELISHASNRGVTVLVIKGSPRSVREVLNSAHCEVVSAREIGSARELFVVYTAGCDSEKVESLFSKFGYDVLAVSEYKVRAGSFQEY